MTHTDPLFKEVYNEALLQEIEERFGAFSRHHKDLPISSQAMLYMLAKIKEKPRRGEVVMVVPNQVGHVWLHTKAFYPQGVYRLMTGGIDFGEVPHKALQREVHEETGFEVEIERCLAVITYTLSGAGERVPFASYIFLTSTTAGRPVPTDPNEAITDFWAVPPPRLFDAARQLRSLDGEFADWGAFRAVAHQVAGECLVNNLNEVG